MTTKNIYFLFIFSESGICLFAKRFTERYSNIREQLISAFVTALQSFSSTFIGNPLTTIGMTDIKLILTKKKSFFYGILCHCSESEVLLEELIAKIDKRLFEFVIKNRIKIESGESLFSSKYKSTVNEIIENEFSSEFDFSKEREIIEELRLLTESNHIIRGLALYTDKGRLIYSSMPQKELENSLKEVDFRIKIFNNRLLKLYYTSKNDEKIFSEYIEDQYCVILLLDPKTELTTADLYLKRAVDIIKKHIQLLNPTQKTLINY